MRQRKSNPGGSVPIQAIDHSLKLVDALAASDQARGVTELSGELRLAKSTVHRILQTLVSRAVPAVRRVSRAKRTAILGGLAAKLLKL